MGHTMSPSTDTPRNNIPRQTRTGPVTTKTSSCYLKCTQRNCLQAPLVVATAVTVCHGAVDGSDWTFRLTFEDLLGHFTLEQKVS